MFAASLLMFASLALAGPRVAVVQSDDLPPYLDPVPGFLDELGEPALVVNIHGRQIDAEQAVQLLKRENPEVVYALGAKAAWAVKRGMPSTPIVYASILEPDRYGIRGPQVTGVSMAVDPGTFLSQLVGFFPEVKRVGVIGGATTPEAIAARRDGAEVVGVTLVEKQASTPRDTRKAFLELAGDVDALWLRADREMLSRESFRSLVEETRRQRIPLLVETDNMVRAGAWFALVPDAEGTGRQSARLALQILDGTSPAVLPVETPESVKVVLNVGSISASGVAFDRMLLDFVDVVIQ